MDEFLCSQETDDEEEEIEAAVPVVDGTQRKSTEWDDEVDEDEAKLAAPEIIPAHIKVNKLEFQEPLKKVGSVQS